MKKILIKAIRSKTVFFIFTTLVILSLNLTPLILQIKHSPQGRTYAMIHNNTQDFFFYQSLMNEGANGNWLTYDPYTSEKHKPSIIFAYFLVLGKVSKLLGLSNALTYHLTRIVLSFLLLSVIYYLLSVIKVPHPRLTYFLFLFAAPLMKTDAPYMNWWTGMDPIRRVAYLPHHMAGSLLLVLSIIFLVKLFTSGHNKYLLYATLITPLLAFIHTPSLFILLLILPLAIGLQIALRHLGVNSDPGSNSRRNDPGSYIGLFAYWLIGIIFMFIMVSQTNRGFPWSQYIVWERNLQFPLTSELIGALGFLFPFAVIGAVTALISRRFSNILVVCWLFVPILLIPLAPRLNISNIRLIQGTPYLPMAILAVIGLDFFVKQTDTLRARKFYMRTKIVWLLFSLLFSIFTLPTLSWSLKDQIREYWPIFGNVYLDNRLKYAFDFINKNFPYPSVTLSTFYTGNYLPAFANTASFIGHFGYTYNIEEKQRLVQIFFENKMLEKEAKEYLLNNKITLVFQGPEEKPIYSNKLYPKLLKPVYDRDEVTLYVLK